MNNNNNSSNKFFKCPHFFKETIKLDEREKFKLALLYSIFGIDPPDYKYLDLCSKLNKECDCEGNKSKCNLKK